MENPSDPHSGGPILTGGAPLENASLAMILLHGRGATARDILGLADALSLPGVACFAPQAAGNTWYPQSFLAPLAENEPRLSSAIGAVGAVTAHLKDNSFGSDRIVLLGFSQGACLALEYVARSGMPHRAAIGLSGGLIGTSDAVGSADPALYGYRPKRFDYPGRLPGMPVLLSCHDKDPHIPLARVRQTEAVFSHLGAAVETRIHPGQAHGILREDVQRIHALLAG